MMPQVPPDSELEIDPEPTECGMKTEQNNINNNDNST